MINRRGTATIWVPSAVTSLLTTLILCGICAAAVTYGFVKEDDLGYCTVVVLLTASITGGIVITKHVKEKKWVYSLLASSVYAVELVLMTMALFGGEFSGVIVTLFVVFSGALIPVILEKRTRKERKTLSRKKHRC